MTVIGIDIGTSYCVLATIQRGAVTILRNDLSERLTPALVAFTETERVIGDQALTQIKSNYKNTCRNIKQMLGLTPLDEVDLAVEKTYGLAQIDFASEAEGHIAGYQVNYKGQRQVFTATRCLAALLTKLKEIAEKAVDCPVKDVVISVPGWASDKARAAVLDAAEIAGLNCHRALNEHAAVALDYGIYRSNTFDAEKPSRVAFIGVGHGATNISVVDYVRGKGTVLAVTSNKHLGGRNIDHIIMQHFASEFQKKYGVNPMENVKAVLKLEDAATKAKKILSANSEAPFNVECLMEDHDISGLLTRGELEEMCKPLRELLLQQLHSTFGDNGLSPGDVHHIEIVGGCIRSPWIQETISSFFNHALPLSRTLNMDETVARGCALQAAMLDPRYRVREFNLVDCIFDPITVEYPVGTEPNAPMKTSILFDKGSNFGVKKWLTFNRDTSFEMRLNPGTNGIALVSTIEVPQTDLPGTRRVKAAARLSLHGTVCWEAAQLLLDEEVEEPVKEKRPIAPAPDAPEGAPEQFEEVEVMKKKVKTKRLDCKIVSAKRMGYIEPEVRQLLRSEEIAMINDDLEQQKIKEMMNDLEAYIYHMKDKLSSSGALHQFATSDELAQADPALSAAQDWLYDTLNGTKETYEGKLNELKKICGPAERRHQASESRKEAVNYLYQTSAELRAYASSPDWSHVDQDKMASLQAKVAETEKWMNHVMASIAAQPACVDVPTTAEQIFKEVDALVNFSKTVLVPKPAEASVPASTAPVTPESSAGDVSMPDDTTTTAEDAKM